MMSSGLSGGVNAEGRGGGGGVGGQRGHPNRPLALEAALPGAFAL